MSWTSDPELEELFRNEVTERAAALVEGAVRYAAREHDEELTADMYREGHSIKGTARVMGFEAISVAGKLLESTWRAIDTGDLGWDADVADALNVLAEALPEAIDANRDRGTFDMTEAVEALEAALTAAGRPPSPRSAPPEDSERRQPLADPVPFDVDNIDDARGHEPPPELADSYDPFSDDEDGPSTLDLLRARSQKKAAETEATVAASVDDGEDVGDVVVAAAAQDEERPARELDVRPQRRRREDSAAVEATNLQLASAVDGFEVGGLLGAVQDWATGQTTTVNAGRLYRVINGIAALRVEAEAILHKAQENRLATGYDAGDLTGAIAALTAELTAVEQQSVELTAVPVGGMLATLPQLVGFVSRKLGKDVAFDTNGGDVLVDRAVLDAIGDPIRQLVVNAVRHGIELPGKRNAAQKPATGRVSVDVKHLDGHIQVTVSDDGDGIDWDGVGRQALRDGLITEPTSDPKALLPVLFSEGFTTATETELGGSGSGLASVAGAVEALLGRLSIRSEAGRGTIARFAVPTSRALQRVVIIEDGGLRWGLPDAAVEQIIPLAEAEVDWEAAEPELTVRGSTIPLYAISQVVGGGAASLSEVLVVSHRTGKAAFAVGKVEMVREVATKELGPLLQGPRHITGAALLGAGEVVLVLDPFEVVERAKHGDSAGTLNGPRLLIVDDSPGVRAVVSAALSSNGFVTTTVSTAQEALDHLETHHIDAMVVDYQMPGEDGVSLVRKIRAGDQIIPIVMLSGVADIDDQKRALDSGADAVLDKSDLREGALAATLHHLLTRAAEQPSVEQAEPVEETSANQTSAAQAPTEQAAPAEQTSAESSVQ